MEKELFGMAQGIEESAYIDKIAFDTETRGLTMNKLKLAACGVNCNECGTYNKEHDINVAESLVEWYRAEGWIGKDEGAEAVQKNPPFCKGCWGEKSENHFCKDCYFRTCCEEKGINHCGYCGDFPCEPYKEWVEIHDSHKKAMEYLLSIKANP